MRVRTRTLTHSRRSRSRDRERMRDRSKDRKVDSSASATSFLGSILGDAAPPPPPPDSAPPPPPPPDDPPPPPPAEAHPADAAAATSAAAAAAQAAELAKQQAEQEKLAADRARKAAAAAAKPRVAKPVAAIFNADEEEEQKERERQQRKKMKLERIDYGEHAIAADKKAAVQTAKSIIDQIPTDTDELFGFAINWDTLDKYKIAEQKMRPWIQKKLIEYLGEEEPTLTDYITTLVKQHKTPAEVMDEVVGILDSDSKMFVVKMWRMLLFEVLKAEVPVAP